MAKPKIRDCFGCKVFSYCPDGIRCRECYNIRSREKYHRRKDKINARRKQRRELNKDQVRAQYKIYRFNHRDTRREYDREWSKKNRDKKNAAWNRRRDSQRRYGGLVTAAQWEKMLELCGYRCLRCGSGPPLVIDHVVPVSKGGSSSISNLQPLCESCNLEKHVKVVDYRKPNQRITD